MKKLSLLLVIFMAFAITSYASYIENLPITLTQPDGEEIECFTTGDEFYNWVHDANGYTLIRDPQTGIIVYAELEKDELVSTGYRVGTVDPASIGLTPRTIISAAKRQQLRSNFLSQTPPIKLANGGEQGIMNAGQNNGTVNNLVIFIRFAGELEFTRTVAHYESMFNSDLPNVSSMYGYFKTVSRGQTLIPSHFYPTPSGTTVVSYQDINARSYYQPYDATTNPTGFSGGNDGTERRIREHDLLKRAIEHVKSQIPPSLNLDFNNDG